MEAGPKGPASFCLQDEDATRSCGVIMEESGRQSGQPPVDFWRRQALHNAIFCVAIMRFRIEKSSILLVALSGILLGPLGAEGQVLPSQRTDHGGAEAQFEALLLQEFREVLAEWAEAVNEGDVAAAKELYTEDAFLYLDEGVRGRGAIESALREWLPDVSDLRVAIADFEGSGKVTYGSARVSVTLSERPGIDSATMLLVLRREGRRTWRIRSQTFLTD